MRRALRLLVAVLALPLAYLAASLVLPLIPGPGPDLSGPPAHTIGFVQGKIHTDILFPLADDTRARFAFADAAGVPVLQPDAKWLALGWGSAAFYTTSGSDAGITASAFLTAATGDSAVIRLDVLGPLPDHPDIRFLSLSDQQYQALLAEVLAAFASRSPLDHPGFSGRDAFFQARGRFHAFHTCNAWLGERLRAAGVRFGLWTPANWSVSLALGWHHDGRGD